MRTDGTLTQNDQESACIWQVFFTKALHTTEISEDWEPATVASNYKKDFKHTTK